MLTFKLFVESFLVEAAKDAPGILHTEHVADRTFDGAEEAHHAVNTLHGVVHGKTPITRKIDDRMSFQVKREKDGRVGVKYKGTGSTYNYSQQDIQKQHGHKPYLAGTLSHVLAHAGKVIPEKAGEYQGGFMSSPESRTEEGGKIKHTPNTLTYSTDKNSEEGKKLAKSKVSMTIHTRLVGPTGKPEPLTDMTGFHSHPDVHMVNHLVSKKEQTLSPEHKKAVMDHVDAASKLMKGHKYGYLDGHKDTMRTYVNSTVDSGERPNVESYKTHLAARHDKEIAKMKTDKGKAAKTATRDAAMAHIDKHQKEFKRSFDIHHHVQTATNLLANNLNHTAAGEFEHHIGEKKSGPEGFVANGLKIVNRTEFSKANRERGAVLKAKAAAEQQ
jgi:hypothetical protein